MDLYHRSGARLWAITLMKCIVARLSFMPAIAEGLRYIDSSGHIALSCWMGYWLVPSMTLPLEHQPFGSSVCKRQQVVTSFYWKCWPRFFKNKIISPVINTPKLCKWITRLFRIGDVNYIHSSLISCCLSKGSYQPNSCHQRWGHRIVCCRQN